MDIHTPQSYVQASQQLQALGNLIEAFELVEKAIALDPNYAEAHLEMGKILDQNGQLEDALSCYEEALRLSEGLWEARWRLGTVYDRKGWAELALDTYEQVMAAHPQVFPPEEHVKVAQAFLQRQNLPAALACIARAGNRSEAWKTLAQTAIAQENLPYALQVLTQLEEQEPDANLAPEYTELGKLCLKRQDRQTAITYLQKAIVFQPDWQEAHFHLACSFAQAGQVRDAFLVFEEVLAIDPYFAPAYYELGILACRIQKWEESHAFFTAARSLDATLYPEAQAYIDYVAQKYSPEEE